MDYLSCPVRARAAVSRAVARPAPLGAILSVGKRRRPGATPDRCYGLRLGCKQLARVRRDACRESLVTAARAMPSGMMPLAAMVMVRDVSTTAVAVR